jgi:hypothetical protein
MAYERRRTLPMRMTLTLVVRAPYRATLERRTKRLRQRVKGIGAELRVLRWEQRAGWLAVAPLRRTPLSRRGLPVETGTVARTYPFSAGTLAVERRGAVWRCRLRAGDVHHRGVPEQESALCWYGTSGAGKGYSLRVLLWRERFANGLRVYGIDQDEQQEYAAVVSTGATHMLAYVQVARGLTALREGRHADAYAELHRIFEPADPAHHLVPCCWYMGDLAEAHSDHRAEAQALVAQLQPLVEQTRSSWIQAAMRFARAQLANDTEADSLFQEALAADMTLWPFQRGRLHRSCEQPSDLRVRRRAREGGNDAVS